MRIHRFAVLVVATLAGCTTPSDVRSSEALEQEARAGETRVVFAAVLCAYVDARATIDAPEVVQLDDEIARLRRIFAAVAVEPRPCSDPLIRRLAECIRVWPEASGILSEWRASRDCSVGDVAHYK